MRTAMRCPHCGSAVEQDPWKLLASETAKCESCGTRYKAVFSERSPFIALAVGAVVWFVAFLLVNAAGYREISEAVASAVAVMGVAVCGYRYALSLKVTN